MKNIIPLILLFFANERIVFYEFKIHEQRLDKKNNMLLRLVFRGVFGILDSLYFVYQLHLPLSIFFSKFMMVGVKNAIVDLINFHAL